MADAVDRDHERPVRDPVADDHLLPQRLGVELGVVGLGADRRRIDQDLGTGERVCAGELRKPLVPARRAAKPCGVIATRERHDRERVPVRRPRPEVMILVVARGHGDVKLAGARDEAAVGAHDDRRVVAEAVVGVGALVERCVYVGTGLERERGCEGERRPSLELLGLGSRRAGAIWCDGEVAREGQLLKAHDAGALGGRHPDPAGQRLLVLARVWTPPFLDEPDAQRRPFRAPCARGRTRRRERTQKLGLVRHVGSEPAA